MRPSFKYIDEAHEKIKARKEEESRLQANAAPVLQTEDEEAKLVTVSLHSKVSDKTLQRERKSHAWLLQQEQQDEPIKLDFIYRDDQVALGTFERLTKTAHATVPLDVSRTEYMDLITPEQTVDTDPVKAAEAAWDRTGGYVTFSSLIWNISQPPTYIVVLAYLSI